MNVTQSFKVEIGGTEHVLTKKEAEALRDALNKVLETPVKVTVSPSVDGPLQWREKFRKDCEPAKQPIYPSYNPYDPAPVWSTGPIVCVDRS